MYAPRYVSGPGELTFVNFIAERPHVVHNVYLQTMVEVGLIGLGLFLAIIVSARWPPRCAPRGGSSAGGTTSPRRSRRAVFVGLLAALVASFFISNGNGFQIWVLLAFGPMLLRLAQREEDPRRARRLAPAPALPQAPPLSHSPGAGLAGLKRAHHAAQSADQVARARDQVVGARAPSVRPKITAAASPPSV